MKDNIQHAVFIQLLATAQPGQSINISFIQRHLRMGFRQACQLHQDMLAEHWIEITAEGYMPVPERWAQSRSAMQGGRAPVAYDENGEGEE